MTKTFADVTALVEINLLYQDILVNIATVAGIDMVFVIIVSFWLIVDLAWEDAPRSWINSCRQRTEEFWRITEFCVDKKHRNHGMHGVGLHAAMGSIRKKGGVVEASQPPEKRG